MTIKNFHLHLPIELYLSLKKESKEIKTPVTKLVLETLFERERKKKKEKEKKELELFVKNYKWDKDDKEISRDFQELAMDSLSKIEW